MMNKETLVRLADDYQRRHPDGESKFSMVVALSILTSTEILLNNHDNGDLADLAELLRARKIGEPSEFAPKIVVEQKPPEQVTVDTDRIKSKSERRKFYWWQDFD